VSAVELTDAINETRRAVGRKLLPHPTEEQRRVIEAPFAPALVVAGAGSGKTETMANRVLWLLANRFVEPAQILGLTFTRKAAGELGVRIRERIGELIAAGLMPEGHDLFELPTIATYNSFANALYRDNAILLGRDGDGPVLGEAAAWQLARSVVIASGDDRLPDLGKSLDVVTEATLRIARSLAENDADAERVRALAHEFAEVAQLPAGSRSELAGAVDLAQTVGALDVLVDLAAAYDAEKVRRGVVEYSDQVALALRAARRQSRIGEELRDRYRVVLLDEYQDTSVVQTDLLAELFSGHPVMAVGDPNQSIYGWRGASAANLDQFARRFDSGDARFALATSWRNGVHILDIANRIVEPFAAGAGVGVETLRPAPNASEHPVTTVFPETVLDEADAVADWLAARITAAGEGSGEPASAALLLRTRKTQRFFLDALRERGVPFHVLGVGGLLIEPEIADLVSALSVIHDPGAGHELLRLLAGARWRIGVRDLHALSRLASWLRDRDAVQQPLSDELRERMRASVTVGEGGSIVDALDFIGHARKVDGVLGKFSEVGLSRLQDAAHTLTRLRARAGLELPDLLSFVSHELRLDLEVAANERRVLGDANLEALSDALSGYLAIADGATLGGFLAWLREAEQREDLSPRPEKAEPGTVQVLTIHGAKGLEWDVVAVPRLVSDELPARPLEGYRGWLAFGQFPWPERGDADQLPEFAWSTATTRKELLDLQKDFEESVRARSVAEERRLAYVAVTRARHQLLLSGSFWATQTKARTPSIFLSELESAELVPPLPGAPESEANPLAGELDFVHWPQDPLGSRRPAVEWAAEAVRSAEPALAGRWARELELLLAERERRLSGGGSVLVPIRVSASRFKDYVDDPAAVAGDLLRPMPERPFRATRLGTLFHSWVENRYGLGGGSDELDADALELDDSGELVDAEALARLQVTFEASAWGARRPVEVEREIHLPFDGHIVVCKIDAVYRNDDRYEVVDWKTGKKPADAADLERKQLQLALYRLAYAKWSGIDARLIDAAFYFVADDLVIRPPHIDSEEELLARWRNSVG
jgi:DNA helicase-2/ATP-dependent DNA helicase PcrA